MILGRSTSLWVSLVAAVLNVAVIVLGVPLTALQVGAINGLALVLIGILANEQAANTAPTFAMTTKSPIVP